MDTPVYKHSEFVWYPLPHSVGGTATNVASYILIHDLLFLPIFTIEAKVG